MFNNIENMTTKGSSYQKIMLSLMGNKQYSKHLCMQQPKAYKKILH